MQNVALSWPPPAAEVEVRPGFGSSSRAWRIFELLRPILGRWTGVALLAWGLGGPLPAQLVQVKTVAYWELESRPVIKEAHDSDQASCVLGEADAHIYAGEDTVAANGAASDETPLCDVRAAAVAQGGRVETWLYKGSGQGDVEWSLQLEVASEVYLADADCAGAAVGYLQFEGTVTETMRVVATHSSGETRPGSLGSITIPLPGEAEVTLPIHIGRGTGRYPDYGWKANGAQTCSHKFRRSQSTYCHMTTWADGGWLGLNSASMTAFFDGTMQGVILLSKCRHPSWGFDQR